MPDINANYGGEPVDIDRIVTMTKIARDIYASAAMKGGLGLVELSPGADVKDDAALRQWVLDNTGSYYHFVGSCKMGTDSMAVVDTELRVRGTQGLRVIDASVMPTIPAANTHASVVIDRRAGRGLDQGGRTPDDVGEGLSCSSQPMTLADPVAARGRSPARGADGPRGGAATSRCGTGRSASTPTEYPGPGATGSAAACRI